MNVPQLPNDILMEIMKHRKKAMYLDMKYEKAQLQKLQVLDEINYMVDDLDMCITCMYDNYDNYDEEEFQEIENTPYSHLLLENISNFNFFNSVYDNKEDY